MGEEIGFENGRISDFQGLVTLTLDRVILYTVMHHVPNVNEIEELLVDGRTNGRTDGRMRPTLLKSGYSDFFHFVVLK